MAAPVYVDKSAFVSSTAGPTVGAVPGVVADDLILLFVETANQAVTTPTPGGWAHVPSSPQFTGTAATAGGVRLSVFYKWADGADTSQAIVDSGNHNAAIKMAFRGVDKTTPFNANAGSVQAATTAMVWPAVTTTVADSLIVLACAQDTDAASTATSGTPTNANLANLTEQHDQAVADGVGGGLVILTGEKATTGATGTTTSTGSTSVTHAYVTLALSPLVLVERTGDLSATESGSDTFASDGSVLVIGDAAATESGADSFAADGTVADSSGITGTLAATESGADTFASSGVVIVKGALAASESGADTFAAVGDVFVQGSLAATEAGADTFAAAGDVFVIGSLAAVESGADAMAGSGVVPITGAMAAAEVGDDTFYATGVEEVEEAPSGHGFVITDTAPQLWWKRKPRSMPVEEAAQKVRQIAGTIERIASKQTATAKEAKREVLQAIAPQLEFMPGFDWVTLYRTILLELHIRREQQAEQERQQEAELIDLRMMRDDDDLLVLLMAA